jgi:rRNA maturation protein Rpf1
MLARIKNWTTGDISDTIYEVVQMEKDKNILVVGEQHGKPITMTYKDTEIVFLDNLLVCSECGKHMTEKEYVQAVNQLEKAKHRRQITCFDDSDVTCEQCSCDINSEVKNVPYYC